MAEEKVIGPPENNPYMDYTTPSMSVNSFALPIKNPNECFGSNFEIFDQLTSPEWQLCHTEGKKEIKRLENGVQVTEEVDTDLLTMCASESPSDILLRLVINSVQEDSFALDFRRKSKHVPNNFFLSPEDTDTYTASCPIDHKYAASDGRCSGGYVNGGFQYYPPFVYAGCQCQVVLDELMKDNELSEIRHDDYGFDDGQVFSLKYVSDIKETVKTLKPESPCMYKLENESRKTLMPNVWTQMLTRQMSITVKKIPEGGELRLISSFRVDFWKNQPKTEYIIVTEPREEPYQFKSTNEVYIITNCKDAVDCDAFEFDYEIFVKDLPVDEFLDWSLYITIFGGFFLMLASFIYFEWRTIPLCIKKCKGGKKQIKEKDEELYQLAENSDDAKHGDQS